MQKEDIVVLRQVVIFSLIAIVAFLFIKDVILF